MRGFVHCPLAARWLVAATLLVVPHTAGAALFTFTLARVLPAPAGNVFALCYGDDGALWAHSQATYTIFKLDPLTGSVLQSFPGDGHSIFGLGLKSGILYGCEQPAIARFNASTGAVLTPLPTPLVGGARGGTIIGNDLYVAGVLSGFPGDVRIGHVDPTTGALLGSCAPPGLLYTEVLGGIASFACYIVPQDPYASPTNQILRIVDPITGSFIEDDALFTGSDVYYGPTASSTELFVSRRDLGQIWVYSYGSVVPARARTWGAIKSLYR